MATINQKSKDPRWWRYVTWFLLGLTIVAACAYIIIPLMILHLSTDEIKGLFAIIYFIYPLLISYYALLTITVLSTIGLIAGFLLKYSLKLYLLMLAISVAAFFSVHLLFSLNN